MKLAIALFLIVFTAAVKTAITAPPPVSAQCRISCVVAQKAEWKLDRQTPKDFSNPQPQSTTNSNSVLIINSGHDSALEIDEKQRFDSSNLPVEIISSSQDSLNSIITLTACWKL